MFLHAFVAEVLEHMVQHEVRSCRQGCSREQEDSKNRNKQQTVKNKQVTKQ